MFSRTSRFAIAFLAGLLAVGCGATQKPATFVTSATLDNGVDSVKRTLANEGHTTTNSDRQSGIVQTEWKDTGFLYGQIGNQSASIVRRFTVVLTPNAQGSSVTVRIDAKRCVQGSIVIQGNDVVGNCQEMDVIPGSFQEDIDGLSGRIQSDLAHAVEQAKTAPR